MALPLAPVLLSAAVVAAVAVFGRRPPAGSPIELPPPPGTPPPPPLPQPQIEPGPPERIPGTDRPLTDNVVVIDAPNGLRVRSGPSTSESVIALAKNGSPVTVLEFDVDAPPPPSDPQHSEEFGWARIRVNDNQNGFVAARFLSSSGAAGLEERRRQEKERQASGDVEPVEQPVETSGRRFYMWRRNRYGRPVLVRAPARSRYYARPRRFV